MSISDLGSVDSLYFGIAATVCQSSSAACMTQYLSHFPGDKLSPTSLFLPLLLLVNLYVCDSITVLLYRAVSLGNTTSAM